MSYDAPRGPHRRLGMETRSVALPSSRATNDVQVRGNQSRAPAPDRPSPTRSPWAKGQAVWLRHEDVLKNLLALLATTGLTSALGFAYWNVAARLFSQEAVGYGTAAVSAMTLISSVGVFGLGTLLIGDLPSRRNRAGLIAAAMIAAAGGSFVLAVVFVLVIPHFTTHYNDVAGSLGGAAIFCVGVGLTAMSVVFDSATIGMQRGGLQLLRNLAFVLIKLATLVAAAVALHALTGIGIFASWVAGIPFSLMLVAVRILYTRGVVLARPDWGILRSLGRLLVAHNWLNLALQVPSLVTPVFVASILAPPTNAAYYVAMTICTGLFILPMHMSTSLYAATAGDYRLLPEKLRFALRVSLSLGIPGMLVLGVGAHFILSLFGSGYAAVATVPMQLIVLNYLPVLPTSYYISVARATGRLSRAATIMTTFAAAEVVAVVIGCLRDGLVGMTGAAFAVATLEAMVTTPIILRAIARPGKHRHAEARGTWADALGSAPSRQPYARRAAAATDFLGSQQQAGLALLMSMATPAPVNFIVREPAKERAMQRNASGAV